MAKHRDMLVFQRVHHNVKATLTHVITLMEHWREAKEAALDAECTTKFKIPAPLRNLIHQLETSGDYANTEPGKTILLYNWPHGKVYIHYWLATCASSK